MQRIPIPEEARGPFDEIRTAAVVLACHLLRTFGHGLRESRSLSTETAPQTDPATGASFLVEGSTCWRRVHANRAASLIDAAAYFGALRSSLLKAQRSIFIMGWELNSSTCLEGVGRPNDRAPRDLGRLLKWIRKRRRQLEIRILLWNHPVIYAARRELFPRWIFGWRTPRRIEVLLDSHVPLGASHHEKLIVIDDCVAYCGGVDLTLRRWDTQEHRADDPRRCDPYDRPYEPVHDVQMVVDGEAAAALGERARERWVHAGGQAPEPVKSVGDCWPPRVAPDFTDARLGIIRTLGALQDGSAEIREVERSTMDAISRAEKLVYIENQYITSRAACEALLARMRANPALEALILTTRDPHGWLEAETMGVGRQYFMAAFDEPHLRRRVHFLCPFVRREAADSGSGPSTNADAAAGEGDGIVPITVHAKVLIVDDAFLRIGSSNLNNRSMGFDTECDLGLEAVTAEHRLAIASIRNRLIAEHWGCDEAAVATALASGTPVIDALGAVAAGPRGVAPLPRDKPTEGASDIVAQLGDPERIVTAERLVNDIAGLKSGRPVLKWALGLLTAAALVAALVLLGRELPAEGAGFTERVAASIEALRGNRWRVPLVLLAFVAGGVVSFPILVLIGATIVALGPVQGFLCAAAGTLLAAATSFAMGRIVGRQPMRKWLGKRGRALERQLEGRGVVTVALLRKVPVAPFTIVNMFLGASGIPFREFIAGTALGMLPGIAAFALVGDRVADVWRNPTPANVTLVALAITLWICIVLGMQRLINRVTKK